MADIKPFCSIRPGKGLEANVAALPYDVYNRQEAKEAVKGNPLSFLNIDRAETGLADEVDTYDPKVYERAQQLLTGQIADGTYIQDEKPCYYLYELTMQGRSQTGIVACASVDDYLSGVIMKHENTRAEKEADRIRHVDTLSAQTGPIFLAYRTDDALGQRNRTCHMRILLPKTGLDIGCGRLQMLTESVKFKIALQIWRKSILRMGITAVLPQ